MWESLLFEDKLCEDKLNMIVGIGQALGALHVVHALAVLFKLVHPCLYSRHAGFKEMLSVVLLNSTSLAVACRSLPSSMIWVPNCCLQRDS